MICKKVANTYKKLKMKEKSTTLFHSNMQIVYIKMKLMDSSSILHETPTINVSSTIWHNFESIWVCKLHFSKSPSQNKKAWINRESVWIKQSMVSQNNLPEPPPKTHAQLWELQICKLEMKSNACQPSLGWLNSIQSDFLFYDILQPLTYSL